MTTQQMLDDRYGRRHAARSRRWVWTAVGAALAAAVAVVVWMAFANPTVSVDAEASGFTVHGSRGVSLTYQVTAPAGARVACVLEADDTKHGIVGWRIVQFTQPSSQTQVRVQTIPTVAEATTGLVNTCWVL